MSTIVSCKIHPAIGVARVGNSPDEFFIGPEVPEPLSKAPGFYKDTSGALKRQAARFRIYGYDADGKVVRELTSEEADITWRVHVANSKAAWYNFEVAMDVTDAVPCPRRNASFQGTERQQLVIDPGPRVIQGIETKGEAYRFDTGRFCGERVYLGELLTDEVGRLIFLGGRGISGTTFAGSPAYTFANNDGWYDDISDGPVDAKVILDSKEIPVEGAWVVTGPPNYAPDIVTVQTMYDLMIDTFAGRWIPRPTATSFARHIFPLLREFTSTQWVNFGFHAEFGWDSPHDFLRNPYLAQLSYRDSQSSNDPFQELRTQVFNKFRNPSFATLEESAWPQIYGDTYGNTSPALGAPRNFLGLTRTQYAHLERWAKGKFDADWDSSYRPPTKLDQFPLELRPAALDKAALRFCMGGPFHPGCEMTWPMRNIILYSAPFRIRRRPPNQAIRDFGDVLTPEVAASDTGPLFGSGPGDISRWMALPWQTDTASCRSGYQPDYTPYLPTFWPARVPNHVLDLEAYKKVMDTSLSLEERRAAFNTRSMWLRHLPEDKASLQQINSMITQFSLLGIVEKRPGPTDGGNFPSEIYVESQPCFGVNVPRLRNLILEESDKLERPQRLIVQAKRVSTILLSAETNI